MKWFVKWLVMLVTSLSASLGLAQTEAPRSAATAVQSLQLPAEFGPSPTRMQLCTFEVRGQPEAIRKARLSECLRARAEADEWLSRDCKKQADAAAVPKVSDRAALQRACETRAAALPYASLPKRPAPSPVVATEAPANSPVTHHGPMPTALSGF